MGWWDDVKNVGGQIPVVGPLISGPKTGDTSASVGAQQAAQQDAGFYQRQLAALKANPAAAPQLDTAQSDQARAQQQQALQALTAQANGTAPSAAQLQLQQQGQQNAAQAYGRAAALQGRNPGAALMSAQNTALQTQAQTNAQAAQQRASDQANAQQQLVSALGGVRSTDLSAAGANQNAALTAAGQNIQNQGQYLNAAVGSQGQAVTGAGNVTNANVQNAQTQNAFNGGVLSTGGQLAMLSDKREKKNVKPSHGKASEMLEALRPNEHEYKDPDGPGAAHGRQLGIMAQDLAKTDAGRHVLTAMPGGRMGISIPKATSAAMASLAELHQRVKALEGKRAA
jgi:hypothetical protein